MTEDEQVQALERHLREAGYERDELRCQWRRGDHVLSDEALSYLAQIPQAAVDATA